MKDFTLHAVLSKGKLLLINSGMLPQTGLIRGPPLHLLGTEYYRKTWNVFFKYTKPGIFDIVELNIIAGDGVAFGYANMKRPDSADTGEFVELPFPLTIGLKKTSNKWQIVHECHSIPAE